MDTTNHDDMGDPLIYTIVCDLLNKKTSVWVKVSTHGGHREGTLTGLGPLSPTRSGNKWYWLRYTCLDGSHGDISVAWDTLDSHAKMTRTEVGWLLTC
jgi:hypothetical protein